MARKNEVQYVNFYTAGSAAYKFEPVVVEKKQKAVLPKMRRKKKILVYVDPMAILGTCLAAVLVIMLFAGLGQLNRAQQQEEQLQAYVDRLQTENQQLRAEYEAGYDADEIYEIATAMGMIPAEQAQRVEITLQAPAETEEEPSAWENFCMFLTGLFA